MGLITLKKEKFYRVEAPADGISCEIIARGVRGAIRQAMQHIEWSDADLLLVCFGRPEQQIGFCINEMSDAQGARTGYTLTLEYAYDLKLRKQ